MVWALTNEITRSPERYITRQFSRAIAAAHPVPTTLDAQRSIPVSPDSPLFDAAVARTATRLDALLNSDGNLWNRAGYVVARSARRWATTDQSTFSVM